MAFHVTHRLGDDELDPPVSSFPAILRELDESVDTEHGDVSLTHESEWCLSVSRDRTVTFENLDDGEPRHMRGVPDSKIIELWVLLSRGDLASIEREPWKPGYSS